MTELVAGLIGGLIAIAGGLVVQWVAYRLARKRRVLEIAGQFLAEQKSVGFLADMTNIESRTGDNLRALDAQTRTIALGYELVLITNKRVRHQVQTSISASMAVLRSAGTVAPHEWQGMRAAHDKITQELDACFQRELGGVRARR